MAIIKWNPLLAEEWEDIEKALANFPAAFGQSKNFVPPIDVYQDKDNITVEATLPGINPEKVDIAIENDVLTIKGESEQKKEVEEKDYYRKEIRTGSFYRSIALPAHVLGDKAEAVYEDGILKIVIPKAPESKPKTIKVKSKKSKK